MGGGAGANAYIPFLEFSKGEGEGMLRRSFVAESINLTGEYWTVTLAFFFLSIFQFFNSALWSSVLFPPPPPPEN